MRNLQPEHDHRNLELYSPHVGSSKTVSCGQFDKYLEIIKIFLYVACVL